MDAVKKVIKRLRGQIRPKLPPATAFEIMMAEMESEAQKKRMWEADKITKRDMSFAKAVMVRNINLDMQREAKAEEEARQAAISETRMKNLKKARRRQKWLRKQEQ